MPTYFVTSHIDGWKSSTEITLTVNAGSAAEARKAIKERRRSDVESANEDSRRMAERRGEKPGPANKLVITSVGAIKRG